MRIGIPSIALVFATAAFAACSAATPNSGFDTGGGGHGDGGVGAGDDGGGDDVGTIGTGGDGGTTPTCSPNAANYDIPGNNCDDDGDGKVDNAFVCDANLPLTGAAALFAQAIGLCQSASGPGDSKWGVISATYTNGHTATTAPNDLQHGILPKFGSVVVPREGTMFGVLSSGSARETDSDTGPAFKGPKNGMQGIFPPAGATPPPGFPKGAAGCPALGNATFDLINVKLVVKAPANAKGLKFDFDFYSGEWPEFVCTTFNDAFIAYLSAKGFNNGTADNMSFDMNNNPVSVNNGFFDRCTPNTQTGCSGGKKKTAACPGGTGELAGTGFEDPGVYCQTTSTGGGATGWLTSQAPIQPGEVFTIEFMIWDTGDESYDSSVLVDNFQWIPGDTMTGTTRPPK